MELGVVVGCLLLVLAGSSDAVLPALTHIHSKFDYKHSFKGPYLTTSQGDVPFWRHGGSETISQLVRLSVSDSLLQAVSLVMIK